MSVFQLLGLSTSLVQFFFLFKTMDITTLRYSTLIKNFKLPNFLFGSFNGGLTLEMFMKPLFLKLNLVMTFLNKITNLQTMKNGLIPFSFSVPNSFCPRYVCDISATAYQRMDKQFSPEDSKSNNGIHLPIKRKSLYKSSTIDWSSTTYFHALRRLQFSLHRIHSLCQN